MTQPVVRFEDVGSSFVKLKLKALRMSKIRTTDFLKYIGAEVEAQTRIRIEKEKTTPQGTPWDPWSEAYADSKHGRNANHSPHPSSLYSSQGHTLLQLDGGLLDSMQYEISGKDVLIGSNLPYSKPVNAQRQFLGLSAENIDDVEDLITKFFDRELRR